MIGQASPESSWKQASWEDKEGKGAYKRVGCATGKGIQKNREREDLEK